MYTLNYSEALIIVHTSHHLQRDKHEMGHFIILFICIKSYSLLCLHHLTWSFCMESDKLNNMHTTDTTVQIGTINVHLPHALTILL
jgi:hypothetical protein